MSTSSVTNGYQAMEQAQDIVAPPTVSSESSQTMSGDPLSKKRKREESISATDGRPLAKQARSESPVRYAEDMPLTPLDAHKVLTILETIDTDGLLDRLLYFPPGSSIRCSFRSILQDQSAHSLRTIRSALNQLLPSSSHPRSLIAVGASNQQRFYDFAQALFNQVSAHNSGLLGTTLNDAKIEIDDSTVGKSLLPEERKRKYALVQRLPSGDWWSSATVPREGDVGLTRGAIRSLATGQAELVSIVPSQPIPAEEMSSFSTLKQVPVFKSKDDPRRLITLPSKSSPAPKLLDYGVYSTFAPYFDSESAEIGNDQVHSLVSESMQRRRARALRAQLLGRADHISQSDISRQSFKSSVDAMKENSHSLLGGDQEMKDGGDTNSRAIERTFSTLELVESLRNIVPEDESESLKQAFSALQAELGVTELLEENAIALDNLVRMQSDRIKQGELTPSDLEREIGMFFHDVVFTVEFNICSGRNRILSIPLGLIATTGKLAARWIRRPFCPDLTGSTSIIDYATNIRLERYTGKQSERFPSRRCYDVCQSHVQDSSRCISSCWKSARQWQYTNAEYTYTGNAHCTKRDV
ncbi:hypothetical protein FRC14_005787 [Serendipita sp. 396]|nr:hypothetical protein FRC14_005787 [Serendipita sp. 396]KAG8803069.1 hypothetical protein FRC16_007391 [Serendipita sp. 398]KAG8872287.1 hypothetical protein FRC20_009589 [Serendipita sp. 405]